MESSAAEILSTGRGRTFPTGMVSAGWPVKLVVAVKAVAPAGSSQFELTMTTYERALPTPGVLHSGYDGDEPAEA